MQVIYSNLQSGKLQVIYRLQQVIYSLIIDDTAIWGFWLLPYKNFWLLPGHIKLNWIPFPGFFDTDRKWGKPALWSDLFFFKFLLLPVAFEYIILIYFIFFHFSAGANCLSSFEFMIFIFFFHFSAVANCLPSFEYMIFIYFAYLFFMFLLLSVG